MLLEHFAEGYLQTDFSVIIMTLGKDLCCQEFIDRYFTLFIGC